MRDQLGIFPLSAAIPACIACTLLFLGAAESSLKPPPDYLVEEGVWIKETGTPESAWDRYDGAGLCLNLTRPDSKVDLAYVKRSTDHIPAANATFILYRNADTSIRFDANGTILPAVDRSGHPSPAALNDSQPVEPFAAITLPPTSITYDRGYYYFLFVTTFDPTRHAGLYQLRVNTSGLKGGSSWTTSHGNPLVPWLFFRVPSGATATIGPFASGEDLRASYGANVTGSGLPYDPTLLSCAYQVFIDGASWLNGTSYAGAFFRKGAQIPRSLIPGDHIMDLVTGEVKVTLGFQTTQWKAELVVSPNVTLPGGTPVNLSGSGFPYNESYTVFLGPYTANATPIISGAISPSGSFNASYVFPKGTPLGIHNLTAVATQVAGPPKATAQVMLDPWSVVLVVTPTRFHQGGWFDINGSLYPAGSRVEIYIDGRKVHEGTVDENGTFFHRMFTLDPAFSPGIHIVTANATDYGGPPSGRAEFEVLEYLCQVVATPNRTHTGCQVDLAGRDFPPNEQVKLTLDDLSIGELATDYNGSFNLRFAIPSDLPTGRHVLKATAPRLTGQPSGTAHIDVDPWPLDVQITESACHPGGWIDISATGFPPNSEYEVHISNRSIHRGLTDDEGALSASPSLPGDLSLGSWALEIIVPSHYGPPRATTTLGITEWSPRLELQPAIPRPGEAVRLLASGLPRQCPYSVRMDDRAMGTGNTQSDGTIFAYLFLNPDLALGVHQLNLSAAFPGLGSNVMHFTVDPWVVGLSLLPSSGPEGTSITIQASGFPPGSKLSLRWDGSLLSHVYASMTGELDHVLRAVGPGSGSYHLITVECHDNYTGCPSAHAYFFQGFPPPPMSVLSCDRDGNARSEFYLNETVYVRGSGLPPGIRVDLHLVNASLCPVSTVRSVGVDGRGELLVNLSVASTTGEMGIWLDINRNGLFDANDIRIYPGYSCRSRPDMALLSLAPHKQTAIQGEMISLSLMVENRGGQAEDASVQVLYGSAQIGTLKIQALAPGSISELTFDWNTASASPGSHILRARVEVLPGEVEIGDNEISTGTLTILQPPDIYISSLVPEKRSVKQGTVLVLNATLGNRGSYAHEFTVELVWGDDVVLAQSVALNPFSQIPVALSWNTSEAGPGEARIRLRTSPIPFETNRLDNDIASGSVTVMPPNVPPVSLPGGPYFGVVGVPLLLDGSASHDEDGIVAAYLWDLGDGTGANLPMVGHTFTAAGTYTVSLTISDDDGASHTSEIRVHVISPSDVALWPSDSEGRRKEEFHRHETIFVTVVSPLPLASHLYIVTSGSHQEGSPLCDSSGGPRTLFLNGSLTMPVWTGDLIAGSYDMVLDLDANGCYISDRDRAYSGFKVVDEESLIAGTAILLLGAAVSGLRRRSPHG